MAKNKYIGSFRETDFVPVVMPFTLYALRELLKDATKEAASYTHQQICDWAQRYALALHEEVKQPYDCTVLEVAEDIGAQWDMFLYNHYTLAELQDLNFASIVMPHQWFDEWLQKLANAFD